MSEGLRSIILLSYEVYYTSIGKWLIKRRLNLTEVLQNLEICYNVATKSMFYHTGNTGPSFSHF